jgi:NADH:ubiquinone oxidoreductase subunit 5 (subunit L)/multisubunit Na+/H+ antiporter MnhA subunit
MTIIALLLLSGAAAKSAQLGLHSWLPGSTNIFYKFLLR